MLLYISHNQLISHLTILLPFLLIFVATLISMVTIMCTLVRGNDVTNRTYSLRERLHIVVGLMLLFGVSWAIGLFNTELYGEPLKKAEDPTTTSIVFQVSFILFSFYFICWCFLS